MIQNNCVRIILKKKSYIRISDLHNLANKETIESRFKKLNSSYFSRGLINKNPIILELINDYINIICILTIFGDIPEMT